MIKRTLVVVSLLFSVLNHQAFADDPLLFSGEWVPAAPLSVARDQFAGGVIDGKIYVFGGNGNPYGRNLKSAERYDPLNDKWTSRASNQHNDEKGVEELTGAVVNGKLYIFGAQGGGNPYGVFNFVEGYDPLTDTWTSRSPKPTPVTGAPAVVYNGEIYLFGGMYSYEGGPAEYYNVVEAYDPVTDTWRFVTNMPFTISNMALAVSGSTAYLFGGIARGTGNAVSGVIAYDFYADEWIMEGLGSLDAPRGFVYSSAAPSVNGKIYLVGGWRSDIWENIKEPDVILSADVLIYDTATHTFSEGTPLPQATDDHLVQVFDNSLYVIGGVTGHTETGNEIRTGAVWKFELPCTDSDGDGYAAEGGSCGQADCDDNDPSVSPGAVENLSGSPVCSNGQDDDCDGLADIDDPGCFPEPEYPDMMIDSVSNPPSGKGRGGSFTVKESVTNHGTADAGPSIVRYYLSRDRTNSSDDVRIKGVHHIASLPSGASSTTQGTVKVVIPLKVRPGGYFLIACADDRNSVTEHDENNNCLASKKKIRVKK